MDQRLVFNYQNLFRLIADLSHFAANLHYVPQKATAHHRWGQKKLNKSAQLFVASKGKVKHAPQESVGGCSSPSSRP